MGRGARLLIPPHGGYRGLRCFVLAEIVYDGTAAFTARLLSPRSRTVDQMNQAARSASRNIAEGSRASGTSKKMELKLLGVARASMDELLLDYESYLRQNGLELWTKDHAKAVFIRKLSKNDRSNLSDRYDRTDKPDPTNQSERTDRKESHALYKPYIEEKSPETAANTMICLIHQTNFLLDRLIRVLEQSFVVEGGFTEKLHRARTERRNQADWIDGIDRTGPTDQAFHTPVTGPTNEV
jgi:four helix bundle suffix protein